MPRAEPAAERSAESREPLLGEAQDGDGDRDGWSPDDVCVVCFELPRGTALPCGHDDFCAPCVAKFDTCPLCREPTGRVRPATGRASGSARGARRQARLGDLMRHRGGATCVASVVLLMLYTVLLFVLDTAGVDIRCRGFPLVPGGESEEACIEEFGKKYGQCVQGICRMAPAYVLSGCSDATAFFCGTYLRMEDRYCQGAPVYLKNGQRGAEVLFRVRSEDEFSELTEWAVGPNRDTVDDCRMGGSVYMLSGASSVPHGPDYIGYLPWYFPRGSRVVVRASDGLSDPQGLCRGVACGSDSKCVINHAGLPVCECTGNFAGTHCDRTCGDHGTSNGFTCSCREGYIGEFCESALLPGFANTYMLTGCPPPSSRAGTSGCESECLCGNFTRTPHLCDGAPIYWRHSYEHDRLPPGATDHGASLFRFTHNNRTTWITATGTVVKDCDDRKGGLRSTAGGGSPPLHHWSGAPDGSEFAPWSTCNYEGQCAAMRGFKVAAMPDTPPGQL